MFLANRIRHLPGLVLVAVIAGCDMGGGHMMGAGAPVNYANNGERIYFTGASGTGDPITPTGGNMHMRMMGGGCASCHGADRTGGRMMPQFWLTAPPLTPEALFEKHDDGDGHGGHERYTDETLQRAVFKGVDPAGKPLKAVMPRWSMSDRDWNDLLAYLKHG